MYDDKEHELDEEECRRLVKMQTEQLGEVPDDANPPALDANREEQLCHACGEVAQHRLLDACDVCLVGGCLDPVNPNPILPHKRPKRSATCG